MRLSAPRVIIFWIATIVAILAVVSGLGIVSIPVISANAFYFLTGAYVLLALGVLLKGL